ncbi:cytochrome P450 [Aspergillus pseudodeflectus]|uniref:Cytochrome P450 n=1 Tax=Aspergillus pseudodeflectus TaxID=176178 RepID=A0ABR4K4Z8_9EURO
MLWTTIAAIPAIWTIHTITSLLRNRSLARKTNLPYILFPFSEANLFYIFLLETRWFRHLVTHVLPATWADYIDDSTFKLRWTGKDRMAKRYGGVYLYVTPGGISCNVTDADVVEQVCKARHSFVKPVKHLEAFEMYGTSVFTSEGPQWSYHHRYTAPAFNDKNNALVWRATMGQAREMLEYWESKYPGPGQLKPGLVLPDAREDMLELSLNVISDAGFGVKLPFKPSFTGAAGDSSDLFQDSSTPPTGYQFTFRGVMEYMNRSMLSVFFANGVLPKWVPHRLVPFFRKDFAAHEDLEKFLHALIRRAETAEDETHNLLERLVRSRREEQEVTNKRNPGLSDAEVLGNVYIFSIAGHETTATTLRFALVLLAIHENVQETLHREIVEVLGDGPLDSEYESAFPRLVTPLCIMLETLRLYPPVVSIPKLTPPTGAELVLNEEIHHLPPNVRVNLNCNALHNSSEYWGPDAGTWDPSRWDKRNPDSFLAKNDGVEGLSGPGLESNRIHKPHRGCFIPFSDGMRACVGRKFAQAEFVAALVVLFRDYRVTPATLEGETIQDARKRTERALQESSTFLTLSLTDKVPLIFQRRAST